MHSKELHFPASLASGFSAALAKGRLDLVSLTGASRWFFVIAVPAAECRRVYSVISSWHCGFEVTQSGLPHYCALASPGTRTRVLRDRSLETASGGLGGHAASQAAVWEGDRSRVGKPRVGKHPEKIQTSPCPSCGLLQGRATYPTHVLLLLTQSHPSLLSWI